MAGARNKARTRAFQILFEADHRGVSPQEVLANWVRRAQQVPRDEGTPQVGEYTMELVEGYVQHAARIDELIASYAVGWTLDRMPMVDRTLLRLGAFELIWEDAVPDAVVLDEVVQLAKEFSGDEAPGFVNGLLARLQELKPSLRASRD
ncbi:transcription antitermination factor NusB [Phaeacidiphilus oryzae]|uniref:transcription antitermination factor NusB n=1 Tax=Phaeacidiphilus oryzae TaxID=348818 RepID=UPI0005616B80|nr:transcription antitermination factor NusB [Phaeacidiphilus oryzae]